MTRPALRRTAPAVAADETELDRVLRESRERRARAAEHEAREQDLPPWVQEANRIDELCEQSTDYKAFYEDWYAVEWVSTHGIGAKTDAEYEAERSARHVRIDALRPRLDPTLISMIERVAYRRVRPD